MESPVKIRTLQRGIVKLNSITPIIRKDNFGFEIVEVVPPDYVIIDDKGNDFEFKLTEHNAQPIAFIKDNPNDIHYIEVNYELAEVHDLGNAEPYQFLFFEPLKVVYLDDYEQKLYGSKQPLRI